MGAPPGAMQAPPPPPMWMPMPQQAAPGPAHTPVPWGMISLLARFVGFALLFIGTVIVILGVEPSGNCFTSTACNGTGWLGGAANWLVAGRLCWALGLFGLGAGAGIKLHWKLGWHADAKPEEVRFITWERIANYAIIIVAIVLLFDLMGLIPLATNFATAGL